MINRKKSWVILLLAVIALFVMSSGRLLWQHLFNGDSPVVEQGVLDLREWKEDGPIVLDGTWEFYPSQFIISDATTNDASQSIVVPGNWGDSMNAEQPTPFGYGSYRLTLLLDPEEKRSYTIRVSSVRSASKLYVNGILLGQAGVPDKSKEDYYPYNIPYNATFTNNAEGIVEVVIEASNFVDSRGGGLIRSLKFGTEQAIFQEVTLSSSLQLLLASIFLLHALYAIMLYIAKLRQSALLWFALFVISFMTLVMVGSEDKLFSVWFDLGYTTSFRLVLLSIVLISVTFFQLVHPYLMAQHKKYYYIIQVINLAVMIGALLLPLDGLLVLNNVYTALLMVVVVVCSIVFLFYFNRGYTLHSTYVISLLALVHHLTWWLINMIRGEKLIYYPFDLIIAISALSIMYSHHYIQALRDKTLLAEQLQRNIEQRDDFLANTSHELRNPLHSIVNIAEVILNREQLTLSKRSIHDLQNILTVGQRLTLLLNEMLDEMSLKGTVRIHQTSFSLHKLATGVQDLLSYMRRDKDVVIINNIDQSFPPVWGDENRTIQILYNLMHNALKFTSKGSITITAKQQITTAKIIITDTGIGMSMEEQKRIFDPYEIGEAGATSGQGGFGLGLSISKKLIELQGGTIHVSSKPGEGTIFSFTMPLAKAGAESQHLSTKHEATIAAWRDFIVAETASAADAKSAVHTMSALQQPEEVKQEGEITAGDKRAKVLLIDDDPINLDILYAILENQELVLTCSTSVEHALKLIEQEEWDLVISDVMMPVMSGYEFTRWIRQRYSLTELPVLLLTARSQTQDLQHAFACGANDYIRKPMDANEVRSRVHALTSMKQAFHDRVQLEAAWLQAQIQPHFFFNTINSVIALSEIDIDKMKHLLTAFSTYLQDKYRYNSIHDMASIEEELGMVRTYLYIEQARFGERLQVAWEVDKSLEFQLPPLTIQPLVENAVRHGLMSSEEGGCVTIRIEARQQHIEISVLDNGVGMNETEREVLLKQRTKHNHSVGLLNTNHRLKWHYRQGLTIESEPQKGTKVSFVVPKLN